MAQEETAFPPGQPLTKPEGPGLGPHEAWPGHAPGSLGPKNTPYPENQRAGAGLVLW